MAVDPSFELRAPESVGPLILSVPHAGRDYPPGLEAELRMPIARLGILEDRLVDAVARGVDGVPTLIANRPRLWIDLNRRETEIDPGMVEPALPAARTMLSAKVRSGLGLVPRRLAGIGELWRRRLPAAALAERIARDHRPYHARLSALIERARSRFPAVVLLDLHSMPPLRPEQGAPAEIVIGDRFGLSAAPRFRARIMGAAAAFGLRADDNSPYSVGHIVERHGEPLRGIHALQLEIDRSLYLDAALDACRPDGLARTRAFLAEAVRGLVEEALEVPMPLAAE